MSLSNQKLYLQIQQDKNQNLTKNLRLPALKETDSKSCFFISKIKVHKSIEEALQTYRPERVGRALGVVDYFLLACQWNTYNLNISLNQICYEAGLGSKTVEKAIKTAIDLGWISKTAQGFHLNVGREWIDRTKKKHSIHVFAWYGRAHNTKQFLQTAQASAKTAPRGHQSRHIDLETPRIEINYRHLLARGLQLERLVGSSLIVEQLSRHIKNGLKLLADQGLDWLHKHLKNDIVKQDLEVDSIYYQLKELIPGLKRNKRLLRKIKEVIDSGRSYEDIVQLLMRSSIIKEPKKPNGFAHWLLDSIQIKNKPKTTQNIESPPANYKLGLSKIREIRVKQRAAKSP